MSPKGKFDKQDAGEMVESNLIIAASVGVEESFHRYLLATLDLGDDWQTNALRAFVAFVAYNIFRAAALILRDDKGWTNTRKVGAWFWVKLFGE